MKVEFEKDKIDCACQHKNEFLYELVSDIEWTRTHLMKRTNGLVDLSLIFWTYGHKYHSSRRVSLILLKLLEAENLIKLHTNKGIELLKVRKNE